jgi:hypothetical protein
MLKTLALIAPHLNPLLEGGSSDGVAQWPNLARLAGRGSIAKRTIDTKLEPLHGAVIESIGFRGASDHYPSAAVIRTGASGERATGFWLRAQPIHFAAGLDRLTTVVLRGAARMNEEERTLLEPIFIEHLQSSGLQLHHASNDEWLLRSDVSLQLQTVSPEFAAANPRAEILPRGPDAGALRRLMTEMQMLLHEHPVNARRQARGLPVINAIWIHGEGMLGDIAPASLPEAWGEDLYLRGIYRLHDKPVKAQPADATTLVSQLQGASVAVIEVPDLHALEAQWLAPMTRALRGGAIAKLTLMLDEWQVTADRAAMFKLWRRERPPMEWSTC